MATTNIDRLRTVGPRRARTVKRVGCWGDEHVAGCSLSSPMCRARRAPTRCYCPAYHFPHRMGSGLCGNADAAAELLYGPATCPTPAIGEQGMTHSRWWLARCAIVACLAPALGMEGGGLVLLPEMVMTFRAWLSGEALAPRDVANHGIPAGNSGAVKRWFVARRAIVDMLLPLLVEFNGTMVRADVAQRMRDLFTGAVRPPVLPNARKLAVTKAEPYTWNPPVSAAAAPF